MLSGGVGTLDLPQQLIWQGEEAYAIPGGSAHKIVEWVRFAHKWKIPETCCWLAIKNPDDSHTFVCALTWCIFLVVAPSNVVEYAARVPIMQATQLNDYPD